MTRRADGVQLIAPRDSALPSSGRHDRRMRDWATWLDLSTTPLARPGTDPMVKLEVSQGVVHEPCSWPADRSHRIYVAFDDEGAVYVGQTTQPLVRRIRDHFGQQSTAQQRHKAGTWEFVVSAAFDGLSKEGFDHCERSAAEWLLSLRHRAGHRHPRQPRPPPAGNASVAQWMRAPDTKPTA